MKKIFLCISIFLSCIVTPVCAENNYPERIVSLGPALTEELYLLGAEERLIGVTVYCRRPAGAGKKEKVGTIIDANLEKIVSLRPDLVVLTGLTDNKTVKQLNRLDIQTAVFKEAKSFNEICGQFLMLSELIGEKIKAEGIIQEAIKQKDALRNKVSRFKKPKVFMQIGNRPLFAAAGDSFLGDLIKFAGGINIATDTKSGLYSREKVLRGNPDTIIIVTMGIQGEQEKKEWSRHKTINAVKNNRIFLIDAEKICSPTPLTFIQTLEEIAKILYEEKNI